MLTGRQWCTAVASLCLVAAPLAAQEKFSKLVGNVTVGEVKKGDTLDVPFLTWGGDVATFHANGGLTTKDGTIFNKLGLKLNLVKGDDFVAQVKNYAEGKTPFLRGTFSQLASAAEVLKDEKVKPVVFLQMTWSAGDHMVTRPSVKTLNDLKGKKVALQTGGPHVGMLDDILRTANLKWKDITLVWAKDITGKDSAAEMFRKDAGIDACFAISPDMQSLTGGLDKKGTGAEGTVKDAVVLVSTATMKRSIADVYACRKDYYGANKATIEKFAGGYIKGCDELLTAKQQRKGAAFRADLKLAMDIYGKDTLPSEADAEGLIDDALFVGIPGNNAFFKEKGNTSGFEAKLDAAGIGFAEGRPELIAGDLDFDKLDKLVGGIAVKASNTITGEYELDKLIYTFKITFEINQSDFSEEQYGKDFKKAIETASLFGNAAVTIRGHADPNKLVREFLQSGQAKGLLKVEKKGDGNVEVTLKDGKKLDVNDPKSMKTIADMVAKEDLSGATVDPKGTLELVNKLSQERAEKVQAAVLKFATGQKFVLDQKQIKPVGLGVLEPVVSYPKTNEDAAKNRRVEFSIYSIKVKGGKGAEDVIFDF